MGDEQREQALEPSGGKSAPKWDDPLDGLDNARQTELARRLWYWKSEQTSVEHPGPFAYEPLNGLEVFWLAACAAAGPDGDAVTAAQLLGRGLGNLSDLRLEWAFLANANLGKARLSTAHLEGAFLVGANLSDADLSGARLERAYLRGAHLERANLGGARLDGADLSHVHLKAADLTWAHLEGGALIEAHLERSDLTNAFLEEANLTRVHAQGAFLIGTRLEGAFLHEAHLEGADLRRATLDTMTRLNGAALTDVSLDQIVLEGTNLAVVDWEHVLLLGDELRARRATYAPGDELRPNLQAHEEPKPLTRNARAERYAAAARAYRLLAVALQAQGLGDEAARYFHRAQIMRRKRRWFERRLGSYLLSGFLALFAGYGYSLRRVVSAYGITVALFAALYLLTGVAGGGTPISWQAAANAAQISLNAIHGRVFFAEFGLDTLQSWLATVESIMGIIIEGVFVAVLIQRLFSH